MAATLPFPAFSQAFYQPTVNVLLLKSGALLFLSTIDYHESIKCMGEKYTEVTLHTYHIIFTFTIIVKFHGIYTTSIINIVKN